MKNRINWLSILQGWAMLWVVIGHAPLVDVESGPNWVKVLFDFAYSFHMPLFMLISGWLFYITRMKLYMQKDSRWSYERIIKDKAIRLLLPGMLFSVIAFGIKFMFPGEMVRPLSFDIKDIIHALLYPFDNPLRELWFVVTLFWFFLMTPLWKFTIRNNYISGIVIVALLILNCVNIDCELLCIGRVFRFGIWFYLGILISKEDIVKKVFEKNLMVLFIAGIVIYIYGMYTLSFITTLGGVIFSIVLSLLFDKHLPKLFFSFRNYTYQIFLMGIFAQILVKILYVHVDFSYTLMYLLCIAVGIYIPVFVSIIIKRINWKPLLLCVGLKKN